MKHNKKRNIGIVYELLLRHISSNLIENNISEVKKATKIIETHFHKKSPLYREFRLVNALINSDVRNTEIAATIMTEAKDAARRIDREEIDKAKSKLIRDINYTLKDQSFYYRSIPNYVDYANVQNLVSEWGKKDKSDLKKMVILESKVVDVLLKEKTKKDVFHEKRELDSSHSDKLVVKLMTEKINQKYDNMSFEQKEIIKNYALYSGEKNKSKLISFLSEQKQSCLNKLKIFENQNKNDFISKKINSVREKIITLNENDISDASIVKFMTLTDLVKEMGD